MAGADDRVGATDSREGPAGGRVPAMDSCATRANDRVVPPVSWVRVRGSRDRQGVARERVELVGQTTETDRDSQTDRLHPFEEGNDINGLDATAAG